jgi:hypothetical protein
VTGMEVTPPARRLPRCRGCRRAVPFHAEDCAVASAVAAPRAAREEAELAAHWSAFAAFHWRGAIAMVAGALAVERSERGVSIRAWLVWGAR